MVAAREALDPTRHAAWSAAIRTHLATAFPGLHEGRVAFCWPVQGEPDLLPLVTDLCHQGGQVCLPVVVAPGKPLGFRPWTPDTPLTPDRYGIPTPAAGEWVYPDTLLLPVNAFDAAGYRLGYGGGFFDRTLAALPPSTRAIGVGFEFQRVPSIHPEAHDRPLHWVVTEAGVYGPTGYPGD